MKQPIKASETAPDSSIEKESALKEEINSLAQRLFPRSRKMRNKVIARVREMYDRAHGTDFLVIHSPGGWGCTKWEGLLDWEKSIVTGVTFTLEKLGYTVDMAQYFRSHDSFMGHVSDISKEARFFLTGISHRAETMAEELKLLIQQLPELKIVLIGASQGAAFNNTAMMRLVNTERVYSIELGTFFQHMPRRILTDRTLAVDSNGLMRDPICHRDLWTGFKSYYFGFLYWLQQYFKGNHIKLTHCTNTPGHEYKWEYPAVNITITNFLTTKFGRKHS